MTQFLKLVDKQINSKKNSTKFTHLVYAERDGKLSIEDPNMQPEDYDYVLHIGYDAIAKLDVFKAWDECSEDLHAIYYGIKGDEFEE